MTVARLPNGWPRALPLPTDWRVPLLDQVAKRASGHTPDRSVPSYWDGGIKWLSLVDCDRLNNVCVGETTHTISEDGIAHSSAHVLPPGMVVLSRDAGVGQSAITTAPMAVSQHFLAWECGDQLSPEFLYYWFQSIRKEFERVAGGSTIKTIGLGYFRKLRVPLPPLPLQATFARSMLLLDKARTQLAVLAESCKSRRRGLAQQLLTGKMRLPAFRGEPWSEVRLGEVFDERAEDDRDDLPLLSVTGDRGIIPRHQLAKRDTSNADKSKYKRVAVGDIAYNTMRMWQGVSALSSLEGIVSPAYTVVVPTDRIDGAFAKHLFKFPPVVHVFHRHSQGLVDDTLNLKYKRFAKIRLRIPVSVEEQKKIAEVLDLCGAELALLDEQRKQYDLYKRGLMQRLLSGEIQVSA